MDQSQTALPLSRLLELYPDYDNRPKKRARSSQSPVQDQPYRDFNRPETSETIQHDPDYYFEDGSTVVRVDKVLFKVHKSILSKDSSTFETMFNLPSGENVLAEGGGDDNPVVLQGDTPDQFRSLLWALYSMPHEIMQAGVANRGDWPQFDRFCDLATMVHKYCFRSLETWALNTILRWLSPVPRYRPPHIHSSVASSLVGNDAEPYLLDRLQRVLELAILCDHQTLHNAVIQRLQEELCSPNADLPWFIGLGERFQINSIMGAAYYAVMIQGRDKWVSLVSTGRLTRDQLGKLHNGYYALVNRWERWQAYWREQTKDDVIMSMFPADVIKRLETISTRIYAYNVIMDMHQECRARALAALKSSIKETRDELASFFVALP